MTRRVLITQPVHDSAVMRLLAAGLEVRDLRSATPLRARELREAARDCAAILCQLTDEVDASVLAIDTLQAVATASAGLDHLDCDAARRLGVRVINTPGVLTEATADLAVALMLAVARRIPACDERVRHGNFQGWRLLSEPMGLDFSGATLGIVGMGRIGEAVARRCHLGFGMRVLYWSRSPHPAVERKLAAQRVALDELLRCADFVSLHAPLTPDTTHLINRDALEKMKSDAVLINTARGALIDESALGDVVLAGQLGGVGLDVFEHEPNVDPRLLEAVDRVVLSPHIGSATERTRRAMSHRAVAGILEVLAGEPPEHPGM